MATTGHTLLSVLEGVLTDADEQTAFEADRSGYLADRGFGELDDPELDEATTLVIDTFPVDQALDAIPVATELGLHQPSAAELGPPADTSMAVVPVDVPDGFGTGADDVDLDDDTIDDDELGFGRGDVDTDEEIDVDTPVSAGLGVDEPVELDIPTADLDDDDLVAFDEPASLVEDEPDDADLGDF